MDIHIPATQRLHEYSAVKQCAENKKPGLIG